MTDLVERLREAWSMAAKHPAQSKMLRALPLDGYKGIWMTITAEGRRGLVVQASDKDRPPSEREFEEMSVGAIAVHWYPFEWEGRTVRALHVVCQSDTLIEAFEGFVETLIRRYSPTLVVRTLLAQCVRDFRQLLSGGQAAISNDAIGLMGELFVLSELLDAWPSAWSAWGRPEAERHDFRNNKIAVEVKTSLRSRLANPEVTITSIDQLQPPPNGALFLWWLRLEHDRAGALSFPSILERLDSRLPMELAAWARTLAEKAGPGSLFSERYSVQDNLTFAVKDGFPAIVPIRFASGRLDLGISQVSYSVDLSAVHPFAIPRVDVIDSIRAGALH